jgi:hypothetical protein
MKEWYWKGIGDYNKQAERWRKWVTLCNLRWEHDRSAAVENDSASKETNITAGDVLVHICVCDFLFMAISFSVFLLKYFHVICCRVSFHFGRLFSKSNMLLNIGQIRRNIMDWHTFKGPFLNILDWNKQTNGYVTKKF